MKKFICMLLLVAIAIIPLCGCVDSGNSLSGTEPDTQPDSTMDNVTTDQTQATQDVTHNPYERNEIIDDRITVEGSKKTFRDLGITVSVPADWSCTESNGEDGGTYYFYQPNFNKICSFSFNIISSVYAREKTEDEYFAQFTSYDSRENVKIKSVTKETLSGFACTKVASSYSCEGTEYISIYYDNVVIGFRYYIFELVYPASESETFETVFESIINSLELTSI